MIEFCSNKWWCSHLRSIHTNVKVGGKAKKIKERATNSKEKFFTFDFVCTMCERVLTFAVSRTRRQRSKKIADVKACSHWVAATPMVSVSMWTPPFVCIKPIHDDTFAIGTATWTTPLDCIQPIHDGKNTNFPLPWPSLSVNELLSYEHTEHQAAAVDLYWAYGDAWEFVWSITMYFNGIVPLDARCVYTLTCELSFTET